MCDSNCVTGCEKPGIFAILERRPGRYYGAFGGYAYKGQLQLFCSMECANELLGEESQGTWVPFPEARNAPTPEQIEENLSHLNYDDCYGSRPGERGFCE